MSLGRVGLSSRTSVPEKGPEIRKAKRGLAMRAKPGRRSDRLLRVTKRSTLRVLDSRRKGGSTWIRVRLSDGSVGWVRNRPVPHIPGGREAEAAR